MKIRTLSIIVGCLAILALLGIIKSISNDPIKFFLGIGLLCLVGFGIYFIVRMFSTSSPQRKEQRAFLKAAKKSKKRLQQKGGDAHGRSSSSLGNLTTFKKNTKIKKKPPAYLTVIDGKKGKKKNRASL